MRLLKRLIIALVAILVMKGLILLLDRYSPASIYFHRQFFFSMQLLVIAWMIIISLLYLFRRGRSWFARYLPIFIALLVLGCDVIYYRMLQKPATIPQFASQAFRDFYTNYERNILQYEPCAIYDSTYLYKVIPGLQFIFGNIEYENQYRVNSESFRDDEASLFGPSVICVGDSYTFGWGVNNDQTYPKLLSSKSGLTVLNAGNSSYGTVRELKQLAKADTSVLEYLVIQYCRNDAGENAMYLKQNRNLVTSDEASYNLARSQYRWAKEFFPGKYSISITYDVLRTEIRNLIRGTRLPAYVREGQSSAAANFLDVLQGANLSDRIKVIVVDLNAPIEMDDHFVKAVDSLVNTPKYSAMKEQLKTIDLSGVLGKEDYFMLDTHINEKGHQKVADTLAGTIQVLSGVENTNQAKDE